MKSTDSWTCAPKRGPGSQIRRDRPGIGSAQDGFGPGRAGLLSLALLLAALAFSASAGARGMPWASGNSKAEDLVIQLVTFGPGDAVHQVFGHTALVVRDRKRHVERLYNYGLFAFGPRMLPNFARGRLTFWVGEEKPNSTYPMYVEQGRAIRVQTLDLAPEKRLALARELAHAVLPENREYLYDHYRDNCATRLADAIDRATDGQFRAALGGKGRMTLRDHTRRHVENMPLIWFLMMHAMGRSVDEPITRYEELFLPVELERAVGKALITSANGRRVPLASQQKTLFSAERAPTPEHPRPLWPRTLAIGLSAAALLLSFGWARHGTLASWRRKGLSVVLLALGLVLGGLGTLTTVLTFATDHEVARGNQNVLLSNPLLLGLCVIAFGAFRDRSFWHRWLWVLALSVGALTLVALLFKLLPWVRQDNIESLTLLVPPHLALAAIAWRDWHAERGTNHNPWYQTRPSSAPCGADETGRAEQPAFGVARRRS